MTVPDSEYEDLCYSHISARYWRVGPILTSYALNRTYASEYRQEIRILLVTSGVGLRGIRIEVPACGVLLCESQDTVRQENVFRRGQREKAERAGGRVDRLMTVLEWRRGEKVC